MVLMTDSMMLLVRGVMVHPVYLRGRLMLSQLWPPIFVAARKFVGAHPGMLFMLHDAALGYYRHSPPVLALSPLLRLCNGVAFVPR